jgi:rubrerythrin
MNLSFLFDNHLIDMLHVNPDEVELSDDWKEFETVLGDKKKEYVSMKHEVAALYAELALKSQQLETLQKLQEKLEGSDDLKAKMDDMIYSFKTEQDIPAIKQNIAALLGKVQAVEKVLTNTNAVNYAKFQCFVCMERYVDVFLDPCGHMMCGTCWLLTNSKNCPGCRTVVKSPKKIFTLN